MFARCCNQTGGHGAEEIENEVKLVYFGEVPGSRGDAVRLVFRVLDRAFADHRISFADWQATEKAKAPTGQVPYLQLPNGQTLSETGACMLYAAQNSSLYPIVPADRSQENALRAARIHQIMRLVDSIYAHWAKMYGCPESEKEQRLAETIEATTPIFRTLDSAIGSSQGGSGFAVANTLTIADLAVYTLLGYLKLMQKVPDPEGPYRNISRLAQSVRHSPKVANYLAERQYSY